MPLFFAIHSPGAALVVILGLLLLVARTAYMFACRYPPAGIWMLPTVGWVTYATYLHAGFWSNIRPSGITWVNKVAR